MKLKEYIESLVNFGKENPEALDMVVVTSSDDEGNSYNEIYFGPSKGIYEDREYIPFDDYKDWERDKEDTNAVCVN